MGWDFKKLKAEGKVLPKKQLAKTALGLPKAEPKDSKHLLGKHKYPELTGDVAHDREVHMAKIEVLLLKGVTSPWRIAQILDEAISYHTVQTYIEAIHIRWASQGNFTRMKQLRGEARNRLDVIAEELWNTYEAAKPGSVVRVAAMKALQDVHDRRLVLENLTPKTLPMLAREIEDEQSSADGMMQEHERMLQLARALICHVQSQTGEAVDTTDAAIEGSFEIVPRPECQHDWATDGAGDYCRHCGKRE